jgi:hypothetical protein
MQPKLHQEIEYLNLAMEVEPTLEEEIREGKLEDLKLKEIR